MSVTRTAPAQERVLAFFDDLVEEGVPLTALATRAAIFAQSTVGVLLVNGTGVARTPDGAALPFEPPPDAERVTLAGGTVAWSRSAGTPGEYFLHRLAIAAVALAREPRSAEHLVASPVALLVGANVSDSSRSAAQRRLHLSSGDSIRVVLAEGEESSWKHFLEHLATANRIVASGHIDARFIAIARVSGSSPLVYDSVPMGLRAAKSGAFPVERARDAYLNAADAFRFALPSPSDHGPYLATAGTFVPADGLGALVALCRIEARDFDDIPDVAAIAELVERHGPPILTVLEAYASTESLRKAATIAYMHHNSVAYWVARAEELLGFELSRPYSRARLMIALCMHRIRASAV